MKMLLYCVMLVMLKLNRHLNAIFDTQCQQERRVEKTKILILAANPWETDRLDLGEEYQRIQDLWENSNLQEKFDLRYYPALRGVALQEKVFKFKSNLIHFSGHGEADSIMLSDLAGDKIHEVSKIALAELFRLCAPDLKAVFLNACYSAEQADEMAEQVDYVIGMKPLRRHLWY